jgi:hypothetical protein
LVWVIYWFFGDAVEMDEQQQRKKSMSRFGGFGGGIRK